MTRKILGLGNWAYPFQSPFILKSIKTNIKSCLFISFRKMTLMPRKPLILASTQAFLNSVKHPEDSPRAYDDSRLLKLKEAILRFGEEYSALDLESKHGSPLLVLLTASLRSLGLIAGSLDMFIICASNRPESIDQALLRPGRFDKLLYVGVNSKPNYRERVLAALTRKFKLHENVSLYSIAVTCPPNFTGADMYALCADAWFNAAKRKVLSHHRDASEEETDVIVEIDDFMKVMEDLSPSLSLAELREYEEMRDRRFGQL